MSNIFYNNPKFKIGDSKYNLYMCEGQRGRGKTSWWLGECVKHSLNTGKKFIYIRRTEVEMELAFTKGLFNCCRVIPEEYNFWAQYPEEEYTNNCIYLININGEKIHVGYYLTLNQVKGISIEDADVCLFEEYVARKRSQYKGGESGLHEPEIFLRLLDTIFRLRKFWCILLGNKDTPSNPYNECWKIPFGSTIYKDKSRGIWYEYDFSEAMAQVKANSTLGLISKGTSYSDYSMGYKSLDEVDESLIATKPSHAVQLYNVKMFGKLITIWKDPTNVILYLTNECKYNSSCPTICVTNSDMTINTDFIRYDDVFLTVMKAYYGGGKMRFNSQETASLLATMLSLK